MKLELDQRRDTDLFMITGSTHTRERTNKHEMPLADQNLQKSVDCLLPYEIN